MPLDYSIKRVNILEVRGMERRFMEDLNLNHLLDSLKPYNLGPMERILIGHSGTVQLLLSLFFNKPVLVKVVRQQQVGDEIEREVNLVIQDTELIVGKALSFIPISENSSAVIDLVNGKNYGLGQIASYLKVSTIRALKNVGVTDETIERTYTMTGTSFVHVSPVNLKFRITESFPRELYKTWVRAIP